MVLRWHGDSPEREPSLATAWCNSLIPRCQDVRRDACYSRVYTGTSYSFAQTALLVGDKSRECCCPPDPRACKSWLGNSGLGWKEENLWWMGMANWRCRIRKQWLAPVFVFSRTLLLDGPCGSLGLSYLHSALCFQSTGQNLFSNILIFKLHSPSI